MINGHGDDGYQYPHIRVNFSSNVYQQLDLLPLRQHLIEQMAVIQHYPEPDAYSLVELIAKQQQLATTQVAVTNGATEAIYLIAQAFANSKTAILSPVFSEYADACQIHHHTIKHFFKLDEFKGDTDLCWICNPNNPTGELYDKEQLIAYIKSFPNTCFVIDQSYIAFTPKATISMAELEGFNNVILLHSLTKNYAIAGLRLGYILASSILLKRINYFRMPWAVNSLAIIAGHYLLTHQASLKIDLVTLLAATHKLQRDLNSIEGIKVLPSQTHYFLAQLTNGFSAQELKDYLAKTQQLLIRDASNFIGLDKSYFRVASQTIEENNSLVKAIKTGLNNGLK